jgi:hypothetical protein
MRPPDPLAGRTAAVLAAIGDTPGQARRFVGCVGRRAVIVLAWDVPGPPPTGRLAAGRAGCRAAVLELVAAAGKPVPQKAVVRALAAAGFRPGTVTKALAELVRAGELANPRDWLGYRLPGWAPPGLFGTTEG